LVLFKSFFGLEFGWDDLEADCESKGGRSTIAASAVHTEGAQITVYPNFFKSMCFQVKIFQATGMIKSSVSLLFERS
jgi:hypothetical protein